MLGITTTNARVGGFRGGISAEAKTIYNRIIADGGVSNLTRLNFFVKGLKAIYGDLANVPVCYDAHWIGYKLGSGTGATAGQAAAKLYSLTVAGDAVQSTAASQPLLLAHNGDNYWWGSGVASGGYVNSNNVTTPTSLAQNITGSLQIDFYGNCPSVNSTWVMVNKDDVFFQRMFLFRLTGGYVNLYLNIAGVYTSFTSTVVHGLTNNVDFRIRVTRDGSNGDVKFYTSSDGITYNQLGTTISGSTNLITYTTAQVEILSFVGNNNVMIGKCYRATISNSIGGTPVVDFNPATYNASTSQTQWTSSTGEVWTISTGTATTGYKGVLVDRTIVQGDGVDDRLASGTITSYQYLSRYTALVPYTNSNAGQRYLAGSGSGHLLYNFFTGNIRSYNGLDLDFSGEVVNKLQLFTENFNNTLSIIKLNNANTVTGISGTNTSTVVSIFSSSSPNQFSNGLINTIIFTLAIDDTTNNTATYNLIRSLNNNAF